jgi:hypothetical protein
MVGTEARTTVAHGMAGAGTGVSTGDSHIDAGRYFAVFKAERVPAWRTFPFERPL